MGDNRKINKKGRIGEEYFHPIYGKYTIIDFKKHENGRYIYQIEFENTGTRLWRWYTQIKKNTVKDPYVKTVYGVGCVGEPDSHTEKEYSLWHSMLKRCYVKTDISYDRYGAKGVYVCERWLNFANFLEDLRKMKNYDKFMAGEKYQLDKDSLQSGVQYGKVYSPETCLLIHASDNFTEMVQRRNVNNNFTSKYIGVYYNNINAYYSTINANNIRYNLGSYTNEEAAATVFNFYSKQLGKPVLNNTSMSLYQALCYRVTYNRIPCPIELPIALNTLTNFENKNMCVIIK